MAKSTKKEVFQLYLLLQTHNEEEAKKIDSIFAFKGIKTILANNVIVVEKKSRKSFEDLEDFRIAVEETVEATKGLIALFYYRGLIVNKVSSYISKELIDAFEAFAKKIPTEKPTETPVGDLIQINFFGFN